MPGSFSAALSGLNANSATLGVIGNNLANINTVGFKASAVSFMDLVSQNVSGGSVNPMQVGLGVTTGSISPVFSQGGIESTKETTNAAIQGNGFFVVGTDGVSYTRAGAFSVNKDGKLQTPDGQFVQGYTATNPVTGAIVTTGALTDITVPQGALRAPTATTQFRPDTNLSATAQTGDTFSTPVQIIDAVGAQHVATITYTKTAVAGTWNFAITVPGEDVVGGTAGTPFAIGGNGTGTVAFDALGVLTAVNGGAPVDVNAITTPAWANGAAASTWSFDIMDANNQPALSGFAAPSGTNTITVNGSPAGRIESLSISVDGSVMASMGGGKTVAVAQLALASFSNPKGLSKIGSNRYGAAEGAGVPNTGVPGQGGRGTLIGSALESSTVDIAEEFTKMILAQRGYQASGKTITVSDELMGETLNLKR